MPYYLTTGKHLKKMKKSPNKQKIPFGGIFHELMVWWLVVFQGTLLGTITTHLTNFSWYTNTAIWIVCFIVAASLTWLEVKITELFLTTKENTKPKNTTH
jgi:hypothetical protein